MAPNPTPATATLALATSTLVLTADCADFVISYSRTARLSADDRRIAVLDTAFEAFSDSKSRRISSLGDTGRFTENDVSSASGEQMLPLALVSMMHY
jgi:hypothetical protein